MQIKCELVNYFNYATKMHKNHKKEYYCNASERVKKLCSPVLRTVSYPGDPVIDRGHTRTQNETYNG